MDEQQINQLIDERIATFFTVRGFIFSKPIQILDGRNVQTGRSTGTTIGTAPDQKLSVFGVTPVVQAAAITAPTGGSTTDTQARTAITAIINALKAFGITA